MNIDFFNSKNFTNIPEKLCYESMFFFMHIHGLCIEKDMIHYINVYGYILGL